MTDRAALLDALLADPTRAAEVSREQAVALLVALAMLQVALLRAACRPEATPRQEGQRAGEDQMLDAEEATAMLGVTKRWLYRHAKKLPFTRPISAKVLRFSRIGIQRWLASRHRVGLACCSLS